MKLNIKEIIKDGEYLKIYIKRPMFTNLRSVFESLDLIFKDNHESYLGCGLDCSGKCVIATFVLRNKKDIEPYKLKYENTEKEVLSKYDFVILVKNHIAKIINDGREEKGVKSIYFECEPGMVPEIKMVK